MHILITRPEESAKLVTKQLQDLGHQVTNEPLIHIIPVDRDQALKCFPPTFNVVVTTSQQAIRCLANLIKERDFNLWCVGSESTKVAKDAGFTNIHTAEGSANDLINKLLRTYTFSLESPIIHVSGDIIRVDIVKSLLEKGIPARQVVVYNTQESTSISKITQHNLQAGTLDAVLFYSPRTAKIFKKLCTASKLDHFCENLTAVCLSGAIKYEIQCLPWKNIRIAKKTTTDHLLNAMMMAD